MTNRALKILCAILLWIIVLRIFSGLAADYGLQQTAEGMSSAGSLLLAALVGIIIAHWSSPSSP